MTRAGPNRWLALVVDGWRGERVGMFVRGDDVDDPMRLGGLRWANSYVGLRRAAGPSTSVGMTILFGSAA
jgi:hypothetical protein